MTFAPIFLNLFLCLLLLNFQWREQKAVLYLCFIILVFNLRLLTGILLNSPSHLNELSFILFHTDPLNILVCPFFYLYSKSVVEEKLVFNTQMLLFCLPSVFIFINMLPYYQLPMEEKIHLVNSIQQQFIFRNFPKEYTLLFNLNVQRILIPLVNILFFILCILYLIKKSKNQLVKPKISKIIRSILYFFAINGAPPCIFLIYASYHLHIPLDLTFKLPLAKHSELWSYFSLLPIVSLLMFPQLIYGFNPNNSLINFIKRFFNNIKNSKHEVEPLKFDHSDGMEHMMNYLEKEKPFLKSEFSLHDLSRELNIPHLRVSSFFNKQLQTPFPEYRNRMRISHAIQLFKEGMHAQMSIEGIATICGFKNKSRFYAAFKAEYKMTPTEWIEKNI